jgi:hypothetical protein
MTTRTAKLALSLLLSAACGAALAENAPRRPEKQKEQARRREPSILATGVALTPAHFPRHKPADVEDMFRQGKSLGGYAVFIYQWSQPGFEDVARSMLEASRKSGLVPILAISPTVLSDLRGGWDVPAAVRARAKGKLSFKDPAVHKPFIEAAVELARLKPPYLCLATEINLLAFKSIEEYVTFAHVYKKLYPVIKQVSPDTKVFVSFQWDFVRILDEREPGKQKEHRKLIDIFQPELDIAAFTSYPSIKFATPGDVPADYYDKIFDYVPRSEEVMFMEIGWPSAGKGSPTQQREFVERLPALMQHVRPAVLAWSLLHDVPESILPSDLGSTGLMAADGEPKPAYAAFQQLRER